MLIVEKILTIPAGRKHRNGDESRRIGTSGRSRFVVKYSAPRRRRIGRRKELVILQSFTLNDLPFQEY
jgi:hypothetical protein